MGCWIINKIEVIAVQLKHFFTASLLLLSAQALAGQKAHIICKLLDDVSLQNVKVPKGAWLEGNKLTLPVRSNDRTTSMKTQSGGAISTLTLHCSCIADHKCEWSVENPGAVITGSQPGGKWSKKSNPKKLSWTVPTGKYIKIIFSNTG
jgi:hypothetical protein